MNKFICQVCNTEVDESIEKCTRCGCPVEHFTSEVDRQDYLEKIVNPRRKEWKERGIEYLLINKGTAYEVRRPGAANLETAIVIPTIHKGLPIISIGDGAFSGCEKMTSVTIPRGIKRIGCWAFANCASLTNATIPDGVTDIGAYAFENCNRLSNIVIASSVIYVGGYAFSGWTSSQEVSIKGKMDEEAAVNIGWDSDWGKRSKATVNWNQW